MSDNAIERLEQSSGTAIYQVYVPTRLDVYTYVVAFDGTSNSDDCDDDWNDHRSLFEHLTNKPACTTIQRLRNKIHPVDFGNERAALSIAYYPGPGVFIGRYLNIFDGILGYSSTSIARKASEDFAQVMRKLPASIKEVRVVAVGFSRGAAIARHFLNDIHRNSVPNSGVSLWSTALLIETVSTFQEGNLNLTIPANTEQVIDLLAINEARTKFRPVIDQEVKYPGVNDRLIVRSFPGAHSDVGGGYRYGFGATLDFETQRVAQRMGLLDSFLKIDIGDLAKYGLVDSRGWFDRLIGTPSGFSCGFRRIPALTKQMELSESELLTYRKRINSRGDELYRQNGSSLREQKITETLRFIVTQGSDAWVIKGSAASQSVMGTKAQLERNQDRTGVLKILDGINKDKSLPVPAEVLDYLDSLHEPVNQVEIGGLNDPVTQKQVGGPWWFVNDCVPTEGVIKLERL